MSDALTPLLTQQKAPQFARGSIIGVTSFSPVDIFIAYGGAAVEFDRLDHDRRILIDSAKVSST